MPVPSDLTTLNYIQSLQWASLGWSTLDFFSSNDLVLVLQVSVRLRSMIPPILTLSDSSSHPPLHLPPPFWQRKDRARHRQNEDVVWHAIVQPLSDGNVTPAHDRNKNCTVRG